MTYLTLETKEVELELPTNLRTRDPATTAGQPETLRHRFADRELDAINAALAAGRPLLVRGEPGVGKSQLARAAARGLGRAFVSRVIDARSEARDLFYDFDAVRRLADAQVLAARRVVEGADVARELDELNYVTPGPLWWGFHWALARSPKDGIDLVPPPQSENTSPENGVVVLLDEIDKADSSVPNGLLEALGHGVFDGPAGLRIECQAIPPLVVLTSNEERSLPDAFLRRCLVLHLRVPQEKNALVAWLEYRGRGHFGPDRLSDTVLRQAAELLAEDRRAIERQGLAPPGGAEYLDLLRVVARSSKDPAEQQRHLARVAEFVLRKHPEDSFGR